MNEQKQSRREYFHPEKTKQQQNAIELLIAIKMFVARNKLSPSDLTILNKLIKQLNAHKDDLPSKVIRSMQNKFETVKERYQR